MITPFVVGRGGRLQLEVLSALTRAGFELHELPEVEIDLSDRRACRRAVARARADIVIDCSGADDLGRETLKPDELLVGAENVALAARREGAHSVYISSAKVFGEAGRGPRVESDHPTPTSLIGDAIARAERMTAGLNGQHTILRSTTFYGHDWGPVTDLIDRARATDQLVVEARPVWAPTYAPHFANVLITLIRRPCYGIVHRAASGECNELELLRAVSALAGLSCHVEPPRAESPPSRAPAQPVCLATRRKELPLIPHWRLGLRARALKLQNVELDRSTS